MTSSLDRPRPLILTATMDNGAQDFFDAQRQWYFPPGRNFLKAHLTLFHALPGEHTNEISVRLRIAVKQCEALLASIGGVRFLGNGIAYQIDCEALRSLRSDLAKTWQDWLTPQDRQGFRPHVTVQNKVHADAAKALYETLNHDFNHNKNDNRYGKENWMLNITGLKLWVYEGGPWSPSGSFDFAG